MAKQVDQLQGVVKELDTPKQSSYGVPMSANPLGLGGFRAMSSGVAMGGSLMQVAAGLQSAAGAMMPQGSVLPYLPEEPGQAAPAQPMPAMPPMPPFSMNLVLAAPPGAPGSAGR